MRKFNTENLWWAKGKKHPMKGKKFSKEHREKLSEAKKNYVPWNKGKTGYMSNEARKRLSDKGRKLVGDKNPFWKGGATKEQERVRKTVDYKIWRNAVYTRDNYTCQECNKRGGDLEAHHIKGFSDYPELRLAIDNGLTLCKACHRKTDNYGEKAKNKQGVYRTVKRDIKCVAQGCNEIVCTEVLLCEDEPDHFLDDMYCDECQDEVCK